MSKFCELDRGPILPESPCAVRGTVPETKKGAKRKNNRDPGKSRRVLEKASGRISALPRRGGGGKGKGTPAKSKEGAHKRETVQEYWGKNPVCASPGLFA